MILDQIRLTDRSTVEQESLEEIDLKGKRNKETLHLNWEEMIKYQMNIQ